MTARLSLLSVPALALLLAGCGPSEPRLVPAHPSSLLPPILLSVLALAFVVNIIATVMQARRVQRSPSDSNARTAVVLLALGDFGLIVAMAVIVLGLTIP